MSASVVDLTRDTDTDFMAVLKGWTMVRRISPFRRGRAIGQGTDFMGPMETRREP